MNNIIDVIRCYFNNEYLKIDSNMNDILLSAKEQSLLPYLYPVYKDPSFKKYYIGAVLLQDEFLKIQNEITNIFNKNEIKHMFFKGSVVYKYYPDIALRTRGDIDILVSPSDFNKAKKILLQNDFIMDNCEHNYHIGFKKNSREVELHRYLVPVRDLTFKFFEDSFLHTYEKDKYLYEFLPTYELLFCICHYARDLKRFGAGIRPLIDIYLIFKNEKIDTEILKSELIKLKYLDLYYTILTTINFVFNVEFDTYEKKDIDYFLRFIIHSGIFGFSNDIYEVERTHKNKSKFKLLLDRIFLPYKEMKLLHSSLIYLPFLLPFFYFARFTRLLFTKFRKGKVLLNTTSKENQNKDLIKMYKELGI